MDPWCSELISPELVLVDPDLRRRIEQSEQADLATAAAWPTLQQPWPVPVIARPRRDADPRRSSPDADFSTPHSATGQTRRRRRIGGVRNVVRAGLLAAAIALLGAAFLPPEQAPSFGVPASRAASPISIQWLSAGRDRIYLIELYHDGRLVHAATVSTNRFLVPRWFADGRYDWRVTVSDAAGTRRPGPWLDQGWFIVARFAEPCSTPASESC